MDFKIRPWKFEDVESLVENANNFRIAKYLTDRFPHPYTKNDAKSFIDFANKDIPVHIFAIEISNKAVGVIGIHPHGDVMRKNAELGFWLGENYWGKGVITKAIRQMIEFSFETYDITRIYAKVFEGNIPSQKVLTKNGFKLEATIEKCLFKNEEYLDELTYALRRKDNN